MILTSGWKIRTCTSLRCSSSSAPLEAPLRWGFLVVIILISLLLHKKGIKHLQALFVYSGVLGNPFYLRLSICESVQLYDCVDDYLVSRLNRVGYSQKVVRIYGFRDRRFNIGYVLEELRPKTFYGRKRDGEIDHWEIFTIHPVQQKRKPLKRGIFVIY